MRNKILFVFLIMLFPISVYANSIRLDCPNEVSIGSQFTCTITGNTSSNISSLVTNIVIPSELKFLAFIPVEGWQGDGADGEIALYSADNFIGNFEIGTLKFQTIGSNKAVIGIEKAAFYDDAKTFVLDDTSTEVTIKNNESTSGDTGGNNNQTETPAEGNVSSTYLIDIIIDKYSLDFYKDTFAYDLKIKDEDKLDIQPILEDNSCKVEILGNAKLKNGSAISIVVTDDYGNSNKYVINIQKDVIVNEKTDYKMIFIIIIGILLILNVARILLKGRKKGKVGDSV